MKLFKSNKKILSIDFGASQIKIVEGQSENDLVTISKNIILKIPQGIYKDGKILNDNKLIDFIKERIETLEIKGCLSSTAVINSSSIITREVSIPKVSEDEIKSVIQYQLSEFLPINPDDYVINHLIIGTMEVDGIKRFRIMLVAVPEDIVLSHLHLMKRAGLKPQTLDFQGNCIAKLLNYNSKINGNYNISKKSIASVDIGQRNTNISIIKDGNIEVTRTFDIGASVIYKNISSLLKLSIDEVKEKVKAIQDINMRYEDFNDYHMILNLTRIFIEGLMENIQSVIRYYTSRAQNNRVDLILLQGGYSNLNGICKMFFDYFNIETLKLKSLDRLNFDEDLSLYVNAVGGLFRRGEVEK